MHNLLTVWAALLLGILVSADLKLEHFDTGICLSRPPPERLPPYVAPPPSPSPPPIKYRPSRSSSYFISFWVLCAVTVLTRIP
ncbi:unnamed protein product [Caenorhabditis brenneri]